MLCICFYPIWTTPKKHQHIRQSIKFSFIWEKYNLEFHAAAIKNINKTHQRIKLKQKKNKKTTPWKIIQLSPGDQIWKMINLPSEVWRLSSHNVMHGLPFAFRLSYNQCALSQEQLMLWVGLFTFT